MRLYLSSFRLGNRPEEFVRLLKGSKKVAVILNAMDFLGPEQRKANAAQELDQLNFNYILLLQHYAVYRAVDERTVGL